MVSKTNKIYIRSIYNVHNLQGIRLLMKYPPFRPTL